MANKTKTGAAWLPIGQAWERGETIAMAKDESAEQAKQLPWWQELLLNMFIPSILIWGSATVAQWLEKAWQEDAQLVTMLLTSTYPFIDVYVEKYALQTKTKIDDKAVDTIKGLLEEFAMVHEIELPNMDED